MLAKVLATAHGTATGGRNGHTASDDGLIRVDLSVPKSMGGPGLPNTTTPEHLFACGYAACFGGACEFMGKQLKLVARASRSRPRSTSAPSPAGPSGSL